MTKWWDWATNQKSFLGLNIFILFLVILLAKDPFSGRNIISNLDPAPDSIHYLDPVKSFFQGKGLKITYRGLTVVPFVPSLYTLNILPEYYFVQDLRVFYLVNVFIVILSFGLFFKIIEKVVANKFVKILCLLTLAVCPIFYWYPAFPMAENLLILINLYAAYLLTQPLSKKNLAMTGILAVVLFWAKYVALILSLSLAVISILRTLKSPLNRQEKINLASYLLGGFGLGFVAFGLVEFIGKGVNYIQLIISSLAIVLRLNGASISSQNQILHSPAGVTVFSFKYFPDNFVRYIFGLIGGNVTVAGKNLQILSSFFGVFSIMALFINPFFIKFRALVFYIFLSTVGTIFFVSTYFVVDGRYIFVLIPGLIISLGMFLDRLVNTNYKYGRLVGLIGVVDIFIMVFWQSVSPIKSQVVTNFNHSDSPQNLQAIQAINKGLESQSLAARPVVITVLHPNYFDYYSDGSYDLLPMSHLQIAAQADEDVLGIPHNKDYLTLYREMLAENRPLFVSNYHTGKDYIFGKQYLDIEQNFILTKVQDGCDGECNLYQISLPNA